MNGLLGTGGGMILLPLLSIFRCCEADQLLSVSLTVIMPLTVVSLLMTAAEERVPFAVMLPYLTGSLLGGWIAGRIHGRIPFLWLRRLLGALIILGGIRFLC